MYRWLALPALAALLAWPTSTGGQTQSQTWAGTWRTVSGSVTADMTLSASGDGTYKFCNGTISGNVRKTGGENILDGTWTQDFPCGGAQEGRGPFEFKMSGDGKSFTGRAGYASAPPGQWATNWDGTCIAGECLKNDATRAPDDETYRIGIIETKGEVLVVRESGQVSRLRPGMIVREGERIRTGLRSSLIADTPNGGILNLGPMSDIELAEPPEPEGPGLLETQLKFWQGLGFFNFKRPGEIETVHATAAILGTTFKVFSARELSIVSVTKGRVTVDPKAKGLDEIVVPAGREVMATQKTITPLAKIGKAGARGGVNPVRARTLVLKRIARAVRPCNLDPNGKFSVRPARRGWHVSVSVPGASKWRVTGTRVRPKNARAKKINRRCG